MATVEIKKKEVSFTHKDLSKINSKLYKGINDYKDRTGKNLIIGVTLSWTDYESVSHTKDTVIVADKGIKDADIDAWITSAVCKPKEDELQASQVATLKDEIKSKEEYE